jgi:parvulin-like peptidyl-prolyl isomerase
MNRFATFLILSALLPAAGFSGVAAPASKLFDRPSATSGPLFPDSVVAKGKGFEIKQSQVDEMFLAFKGHRAAMGQAIPESLRPQIESDIIDKLIATQLFLRRATDKDKAEAKVIAQNFVAEQKKQAPSDDSFRRQLLAVGMSPEEFSTQINEQAVVKAVIDREIKASKKITDDEAKKFYTENPALFQDPEMLRASHILIATRDTITGKTLTPEAKLAKKQLAEKLVVRARAGEDFAKLVREFSQDAASKGRGGEYIFPRSKDDPRRAMTPEFEAAAFSMKTNQVSDVVETGYGYHIIKTLERIPPRKTPYDQAEARIKEILLRDAVEKELPAYIDKLKREAGVEILVTQTGK